MSNHICPVCDQRYVYASNMSLTSPVAPECGCTELDHSVEANEPARALCAKGYHLWTINNDCFNCGEKM